MFLKKLKLVSAGMAIAAMFVCGAGAVNQHSMNVFAPENVYAEQITSGLWKYEVQADGSAYIMNYAGFDTNLTIPSTIDGYTVSGIGAAAFRENGNIGKVELPDSIRFIGHEAFRNSSLTSISISSNVETYGSSWGSYNTFANCSKLTSVSVNSASIPYRAFADCPALKTVTIGSKVESIGSEAFVNCTAMTKLTWGANVQRIEANAFENTTALKQKLNLGRVAYIGPYAFHRSGITEVVIPVTVTEIGTSWGTARTFSECPNLTKVTFNANANVIDSMFKACPKLKSVTLSPYTYAIGSYAFQDCTALASIRLGGNEAVIDQYAFSNCQALTSFAFPQSVYFVGYSAFSGSGLTSVVLPGGIEFGTSWGDLATFRDCSRLTSVIIGDCKIGEGRNFITGNEKLKIKCVKGSAVDTFAKNNKISRSYIKEKHAASITFNRSTYNVKKGGNLKLFPNVAPQNTTDYLTWTSGDDNIATVDPNGYITGVNAGIVAIKVTTSNGKVASCTLNVVDDGSMAAVVDTQKKKNIALGSVEAIRNQIYTGVAIKPVPVVMFNSCTKLIYGSDYTVSYKNNVKSGIATVTIKGIGNYTGTLQKTFKIVRELKLASFKLSKTKYTYTGKACAPNVTIKYGSSTLKKGTDYIISYTKNTNAGIAKVKITGKGLYTGTVYKSFKIQKAAAKITTSRSVFERKLGSGLFSLGAKTSSKGKLTFSTNNKSVIKLYASGEVVPTKKGTAVITIKSQATANYNAATKTVKVVVK